MTEHHGYFPKSKLTKILAITLVSVFLFIIAMLIYPYFIQLPEFNIDQKKISNQPVIFESKSTPFWVEESGTKIYSKLKDGINTVNLGRKSGKKNYKVGGYTAIGPINIDSKNNYTMVLERDYTTLEGDVAAQRYYPKVDNPNYTYEVNTKSRKYVKLEDKEKVLYDSTIENNICKNKFEKSSMIVCPLNFVNDETLINLYLSDDIGNRVQIATDQYVNLIPNINFNCEYKDIVQSNSVICTSNKKAKVTYLETNQTYDVIPNKEQIIPVELKDGPNVFKFTILDEHGFATEKELKLNVQKLKNL